MLMSSTGAEIDDQPSRPENRQQASDQLAGHAPVAAIAKSQHEKIRRFQEQQLEQGYKKSKGISI